MNMEQLTAEIQMQRNYLNNMYKENGLADLCGGKEVMMETEAGTVRTIWYGFDDPQTKPVFFDMHGGGFIMMTADLDGRMCNHFANGADCKVINIDYSLAPEHPFPTALNEIYAVVKEVYQNAEKYGIDPNRMAIGGHSAGGNLAAVTCLKSLDTKEFSFVGQILDYPPLDLATSPYDKPCPEGAIPPEKAEQYDLCYTTVEQRKDPLVSPVYADPEDLAKLPPALMILAGYDSLHDEGVKYAELLKDAGVDVELHDFPAEAHAFTYRKTEGAPKAIAAMTDFLKKVFA